MILIHFLGFDYETKPLVSETVKCFWSRCPLLVILLIITSPIFIIRAWMVHFIRLIMAGVDVESEL